ncbi:hypothetical protein J6590_013119 [Homalodisca vitripennis]|nr:hypothetical protein J6590_013119 [Homalodisca vitripennis]
MATATFHHLRLVVTAGGWAEVVGSRLVAFAEHYHQLCNKSATLWLVLRCGCDSEVTTDYATETARHRSSLRGPTNDSDKFIYRRTLPSIVQQECYAVADSEVTTDYATDTRRDTGHPYVGRSMIQISLSIAERYHQLCNKSATLWL